MNSLLNWILWWAKPTLLLFLILGRADGVTSVTPVAVPYASGKAFPQGWDNRNAPDPQYFAERAVDGDPAIYCCLLDDTLCGSSDATIPAKPSEEEKEAKREQQSSRMWMLAILGGIYPS